MLYAPSDNSSPSRNLFIAALIVLAVGFSGCQNSASDSPSDRASEQASAVAAITHQSQQLSASYVRGDIDGVVAVYETDGIAAPGGRDFVAGHGALQGLWALPPGRTILRHKSTPVEVVVDGDHAYDRGYYEGQAAQDGEALSPFKGTYVIVWHRGEDDVWRIAVDMWHGLPNQAS